MTEPLLVIGGLAALALFYVVIPVALDGYVRFQEGLRVTCPETGQPLRVHVTPCSASAWNFRGPGSLRVAACPRWPDRRNCDTRCVAEA